VLPGRNNGISGSGSVAATDEVGLLQVGPDSAGAELISDSGGAGRQRGGLGTRVRLAKRTDDCVPISVTVAPEGVDLTVDGLFDAAGGSTGSALVRDSNGGIIRDAAPATS
jgi:5-oxoprolinase (ATP-hydrolysing)/N-methylhydantoinase A